MPIYNSSSFVTSAINSLIQQSYTNWELIILNDGSTDDLKDKLAPFLANRGEILFLANAENKGLGHSLNVCLSKASGDYIAYLPSDDIYFENHLESMVSKLNSDHTIIATYSGMKYGYLDTSSSSGGYSTEGNIPGLPFQLVQVMHRRSEAEWVERKEIVTDDLHGMYWKKLMELGRFDGTGKISCEWVSHPKQRHRIINELNGFGGIHHYKSHYNVKERIKFQSLTGTLIDEFSDYVNVGNSNIEVRNGLVILIVGELAYNADRILALEEKGHKLYGLWMNEPAFYNTIGPLPFGDITDLSKDNWQGEVEKIKPDLIYGLLNHSAVPFVYSVVTELRHIPFVWHFKESPFYCRQLGTWNLLMKLYEYAHGQIYINDESREWFRTKIHPTEALTYVLDGDLPHAEYFGKISSQKLSQNDKSVHTVVVGRPFGIGMHDIELMYRQKIHLHLYGDYIRGGYARWAIDAQKKAPGYIHLHPHCHPKSWSEELSKYDAGWLHLFNSSNFGDLHRAEWSDLNYPARISTMAVAGIPMIHRDNSMHTVATDALVKKLNVGLSFNTYSELGEKLRDIKYMDFIGDNSVNFRSTFSFQTHVDGLIDFFRRVIDYKRLYIND